MKQQKKFYVIYQITNLVNGKIYIGKHETDKLDDNYFGSGACLKRAFKKYGLENFVKTILFYCANEKEMNLLEQCVVTSDFIKRYDVYNMCPGGEGGDTWKCVGRKHTEETKRVISDKIHEITKDPEYLSRLSNGLKLAWKHLKEDTERYNDIQKRRSVSVSKALKGRSKQVSDAHKKSISEGMKKHFDEVGRKHPIRNPMPYKSENASGKMIKVHLQDEEHTIYECDLQWYLSRGYSFGRGDSYVYTKPLTQAAKDSCSGKGKVTVCNLLLQQNKRIDPSELQQYLANNWKRGYLSSYIK